MELIRDYGNSSESESEESGIQDVPQDTPTAAASDKSDNPLTKRQAAHQQYVQRRQKSHAVIFAECKCNLKCSEISKSQRLEINESYWKLSLDLQRSFVVKHSSQQDVKRRRVEPDIGGSGYKKSCTYAYNLPDENGTVHPVCSRFFLNTLGYHYNSSNFIYRAHVSVDRSLSMDGENSKKTSLNLFAEAVREDILSYNPTISHYRREHAPNVRYLPSDITCKQMHEQFKLRREAESLEGCSYSFYNRILLDMNIHFTKLGHELCEKCRAADIHMKTTGHRKQNYEETEFRKAALIENDENEEKENGNEHPSVAAAPPDEQNCIECAEWLEHRDAAIASRREYEKDKTFGEDLKVSVDMQKVVQLPRMERFKEVIFAKRIVAMNETFAPLGGEKNGAVHAVLWNETISGRKASDLTSVFTKHLISNGSSKNVLYWLDNCASQNKNWNLFVHLTLLVNSTLVMTEKITLKYLEPGHTFMSADAFHAAVERSMRKHQEGEIYTFADFVECVEQANVNKPIISVMSCTDFFQPSIQFKPSVLSKMKPRPKLSEVKQIRFTRGSYDFCFKTDFDADFKKVQLFTKSQLKEVQKSTFTLQSSLNFNEKDRGIENSRKDLIVKKLCPLMPSEKRQYWEDLPVDENLDEF